MNVAKPWKQKTGKRAGKMDFLDVGRDTEKRRIAIERTGDGVPGLFWLGGFKSDMAGSKALALVDMGKKLGLGVTRFDYSGHGHSQGDFLEGTISRWLEEALAVFETTKGPQIVIGSSMGGWLALLLNRELQERKDPRIRALVVIAPAVDMTRDLMADGFTGQERDQLEQTGRVVRPSDYEEPYILTRQLIEDGDRHLLFGRTIRTGCPVFILQGAQDEAVAPSHAHKLVSHLLLDPVFYTQIPDGDHSLSRPQDLQVLEDTIRRAVASEV